MCWISHPAQRPCSNSTGVGAYLCGAARAVPLFKVGRLRFNFAVRVVPLFGHVLPPHIPDGMFLIGTIETHTTRSISGDDSEFRYLTRGYRLLFIEFNAFYLLTAIAVVLLAARPRPNVNLAGCCRCLVWAPGRRKSGAKSVQSTGVGLRRSAD